MFDCGGTLVQKLECRVGLANTWVHNPVKKGCGEIVTGTNPTDALKYNELLQLWSYIVRCDCVYACVVVSTVSSNGAGVRTFWTTILQGVCLAALAHEIMANRLALRVSDVLEFPETLAGGYADGCAAIGPYPHGHPNAKIT